MRGENTKSDEYKLLQEGVYVIRVFKLLKINHIAGLVFFAYAVYVRSKILELVRDNTHMNLHDEYFDDIVNFTHPITGKISKSKIRWTLFIFVTLTVFKQSHLVYFLYITGSVSLIY